MIFRIEYKNFKTKETANRSLVVLDTFLDEHLIEKDYGNTYECILIRFVQDTPKSRKEVQPKILYENIAVVEVEGKFIDNNRLSIEDFNMGLSKVEEAIRKVCFIKQNEDVDYQVDVLIRDFQAAIPFAPSTLKELGRYYNKLKEVQFYNRVKRVDKMLVQDSLHPRPLTKKLVGIRIYCEFEHGLLAPYDYMLSELFSYVLQMTGVMLPNYNEIYISVGETLEQAKQELALEEWYKYTYCQLDVQTFLASDDEQKYQLLFESVCEGLRLIAIFDHLEKEKIEEAIRYLQEKGQEVELIYMSKQNKQIKADIVYQVPKGHLVKAEYKLKVHNLLTGEVRVVPIDKIDTWYAPYSLGKMTINKKEIVIKGRESYRAEIARKMDKLPDEYRINLLDIFK